MRAYFLAFEVHLQDHLPKLHYHFTEQGLTPDLYLTDWYVLFTGPIFSENRTACLCIATRSAIYAF